MIGQIVKVYLVNGTGVDGRLTELNNKRLILDSIESEEQLMILNPYKNIIMIRTFSSLKKEVEKNNLNVKETSPSKKEAVVENEIEENEREETEDEISPLALRARNIAELKAMEAKAEAEQIAAALKKQEILENRKNIDTYEDKYGEIDYAKCSSQKPTTKKSSRYDGKNTSRLPDVFFKQRK